MAVEKRLSAPVSSGVQGAERSLPVCESDSEHIKKQQESISLLFFFQAIFFFAQKYTDIQTMS